MPNHLSTSDRITVIAQTFNVPREVIASALDDDRICSVGYAGRIVIDVIDVIGIVHQYTHSLQEARK